jgi:hypothetical protein
MCIVFTDNTLSDCSTSLVSQIIITDDTLNFILKLRRCREVPDSVTVRTEESFVVLGPLNEEAATARGSFVSPHDVTVPIGVTRKNDIHGRRPGSFPYLIGWEYAQRMGSSFAMRLPVSPGQSERASLLD